MDSVTPPPLELVPTTIPTKETVAVKTPVQQLVSITSIGSIGSLSTQKVPIVKKIETIKPQDSPNSTIDLKLLLDHKNTVSFNLKNI